MLKGKQNFICATESIRRDLPMPDDWIRDIV
jgi:hypothetical protein